MQGFSKVSAKPRRPASCVSTGESAQFGPRTITTRSPKNAGIRVAQVTAGAAKIGLETEFEAEGKRFLWKVTLRWVKAGDPPFELDERVHDVTGKPQMILFAENGGGWWASEKAGQQLTLSLRTGACGLAAAASDASFRARVVAEFVREWVFFDPAPTLLRRSSRGGADDRRLDSTGQNLAARLYALKEQQYVPDSFELATEAIVDRVLQERKEREADVDAGAEPGAWQEWRAPEYTWELRARADLAKSRLQRLL